MSFNEKRSFTEHVVTTPTSDFSFGFEYDEGRKLDEQRINVLVDNKPADEQGYNVVMKNDVTVELTPDVVKGLVRVQRETNIDNPLHIFSANALFVAKHLDRNFRQVLHSQQEVRDGFTKLYNDVTPLVTGLEEALVKADEASKAAQEAAEAAEEAAQTTRSASQVIDESGLTQQEVNNSVKSKLPIYVDDFYEQGDASSSEAFQRAVNYAGVGGKVVFNSKVYELHKPTIILSGQEIYGVGKATLKNVFSRTEYPRGTVTGLIQWGHTLTGAYSNILSSTTTTSLTSANTNRLNVAATNIPVGSMLSVGNYCAVVVSVGTNFIDIDRVVLTDIPSGTTVYKFNEINNIHIHDLVFDFNGTETDPRWGYGVLGHGGKNHTIENLSASYIGSKVVQLSRTLDSVVDNIPCFMGTDNGGTGGHGYVVRLQAGTDGCMVSRIKGTKVRHTTDMAAAHRNRMSECVGILNDAAAHLTHGNGTFRNVWSGCESHLSGAAFHIWEGDLYNVVDGGVVQGRLSVANATYTNTTTITNLVLESPSSSSPIGDLVMANCTFNFRGGQNSAFLRYASTEKANVLIKDSNINFYSDAIVNALIYSSGTGGVKLTLSNCNIRVENINTFIRMASKDTLVLDNCTVTSMDTAVNLPFVMLEGVCVVNGGSYSFDKSGLSFFGLNSTTVSLELDGVKFINASQIARRYSATASMQLGFNQYVNSNLLSLANITVSSIEIANPPTYPPSGTWVVGSRIYNPKPVAGGYSQYIYTLSGWKGVASIEA